jgi:hypothetical protein
MSFMGDTPLYISFVGRLKILGSHDGDCQDYSGPVCDAMQPGRWVPTVEPPSPSTGAKNQERSFQPEHKAGSPIIFMTFYQITRCLIP